MESRDEYAHIRREPRRSRGAPVALFERLVSDPDRSAAREPFRTYDAADAFESVRREVSRILNTRRSYRLGLTIDDRNSAANRAIDYGIPDFSHLTASSGTDRQTLGSQLARAIESFEPRLRGIRVELEQDPTNGRAVTGYLYATMMIRMVSEPVCFPIEISMRSTAATVGSAAQPE